MGLLQFTVCSAIAICVSVAATMSTANKPG
jgi:hypothetical protein